MTLLLFYGNIKMYKKEGTAMLKFLAKMAEKSAKNTNTASWAFYIIHQPKMPTSLIKKD